MNYVLVSKLIFQNFIATGVNVINSTPMLKALIIAYLTENSISYVDADVDALTVEVMKFLSVEEVAVAPVSAYTVQEVKLKSLTATQKKKVDAFIADIKFKIKGFQVYKDTALTKEVESIIDSSWEMWDEKTVELLLKATDYMDFLENVIDDSKNLED